MREQKECLAAVAICCVESSKRYALQGMMEHLMMIYDSRKASRMQ
jgi:hypothetical protein